MTTTPATMKLNEIIGQTRPITYGILKPGPNVDGGVPYVRVVDMKDGSVKVNEVRRTTEAIARQYLRSTLKGGDILLSIRGHVGRVAMVPPELEGANITQDTARLAVNGSCDPRYLFWFLQTPHVQNWMRSHTKGVAVKGINLGDVKELDVPLVAPEKQRRIAAILDKADAIRRKREEGIRLTEELLRSTFLEMFGDPATNPKKWPTGKLGDLSSIRRGSSPRPIENYMGGDVPWIKIGDATKGDSFYITETEDHVTQAGAAKSVLLEPGSLVIANSGVSLGFARILKIKGCVHDGWLSVESLDDRLNKVYLLKLINCLTDHFRAIAPEGTQPNLNTGIIKEYPIPIPPIDLQRKFEKAAFASVELTAIRKKAAAEAESLFGSIVQRAFRGEL